MRTRTVLEQMIFSGKVPDTGGNAQEPPAVHGNNITGDPSHNTGDTSSSSDSQLEGDIEDDMDLLSDSDQLISKSNSPRNDSGFVDPMMLITMMLIPMMLIPIILIMMILMIAPMIPIILIKKLQVVMLRKHFLK